MPVRWENSNALAHHPLLFVLLTLFCYDFSAHHRNLLLLCEPFLQTELVVDDSLVVLLAQLSTLMVSTLAQNDLILGVGEQTVDDIALPIDKALRID